MASSDNAILIENLSKRYMLTHEARLGTLRDTISQGTRALWQALRQRRRERRQQEEFWALRDFNLTVKKGDALGLIGRNGAGKSTLLKLISRISEPTTGRITIEGRIASLLEVGTGFHPDLSGRENIYMNGSILGMGRAEIRRKFDQIVEFAGIEQFLDTPLRRYSSGMSVRLAFAVSAHLDPEILLLDEVLAVGDADFQRKCLGKMDEVARTEGRTILFVSHNLASVMQLCNRVVVLRRGQKFCDESASQGVAKYLTTVAEKAPATEKRAHGDSLEIAEFALAPNVMESFGEAVATIALRARARCSVLEFSLFFNNSLGQRVALIDLRTSEGVTHLESGRELRVEVRIPRAALVAGTYLAGLFLRTDTHMQDHFGLASLEVVAPASHNGLMHYSPEYMGFVALDPVITRLPQP